jgi:starch synthase
VRALSKAIRKALVLYADKPLLRRYQRNGMARDFSWERTATAYASLYQNILTGQAASVKKD